MVEVGAKVDLGFPVKALVEGVAWGGLFSELVAGKTIVSVYMRNNTSSCDCQTAQMREVHALLLGRGIGLIGVSRDTVGSHQKYASKHGFSFPLVSDPAFGFAQAVDAVVEKKLYGRPFRGPSRSAYLIDANGTVLGIIEKIDSKKHGEELLALSSLFA